MCDRCQELEETITQLKKELGQELRFPSAWKLTPGQSKLLGILIKRGHLTYAAARLVLWHHPPDSCDDIIRRHICSLRQRVPDVRIDLRYGDGYSMDQMERDRLSGLMVE